MVTLNVQTPYIEFPAKIFLALCASVYFPRVVCGQLGFTNGRSLLYHHYREEAPDAIYLDNVVCDEASALTATGYDLNMCSHNGWGQHNCGHSEDVGVTCCT